MTMCTDCDPKTLLRLEEPIACERCGEPLKRHLADYRHRAHIRCLLKVVNGWAPPQGQPHYVW